MAKRQGLELHKSRTRDPRALGYGCWTIVDPRTNGVVTGEFPDMSLEGVEAFLERPMIEVELRRAGRAYVESHGANHDVLQPLVREAIKAGMPAGAVALVTELPAEDIAALNRQDGGA
jgi:hypothetical protein